MALYTPGDFLRRLDRNPSASGFSPSEPYRSDFRRDYARLVHSAAFRRLNGKTQLFPGIESDFFRNRLTHSLEVAQVAKSIAIKLNHEYSFFKDRPIDTDLVEIAGLAHDLGHPPFGHNGELALDRCMIESGGFEGNAQTLRILARLEKKATSDKSGNGVTPDGEDLRFGLDLCMRTMASVLKYDRPIPKRRSLETYAHPEKGYYESEAEIVQQIKEQVLRGAPFEGKFKTIECQIMDVADDIAYSTYDLEDAFKAGLLTPMDLLAAPKRLLEKVVAEVNRGADGEYDPVTEEDVQGVIQLVLAKYLDDAKTSEIISSGTGLSTDHFVDFMYRRYGALSDLAAIGYARTDFTSSLVAGCIEGVEFFPNEQFPMLSEVRLSSSVRRQVEILKRFAFVSLILSPRLKLAEHRGKEIVESLFNALTSDNGYVLMPADFCRWYESFQGNSLEQRRVVCDFIAGMTDRYAVEFHARLRSDNPETIFKPI